MKILLSIKPEYVDRILNGTKGFEFRRKLATKPVDAIILYATSPVECVLGEVQVVGTISASPTKLWEHTKTKAGISREKFRRYFRGYKRAHAYILGKAKKYSHPQQLTEYGITHAPQSFRYI